MTERQPTETADARVRRDHLYLAIIVGLLPGAAMAGLPVWALASLGAVCAVAALTVRLTEPRREPSKFDTVVLAVTFVGGGIGGTFGAETASAIGGASVGAVTALLGVVIATSIHHWLRSRRADR